MARRRDSRASLEHRIGFESLERRLLCASDLAEFASVELLDSTTGFFAPSGGKGSGSKTATLTTLVISPGTSSVEVSATQQFQVKAYDQRGGLITPTPAIQWSSVGGTVDSNGRFTAGTAAGSGSVKAASGTVSATASITITSSSSTSSPPVLQTPALSQIVQSLYADQVIDRNDMMQILRSTGSDLVVSSGELSDLRAIVSSTYYVMPRYVRELSRDVVNDNPANLKFQGQTAGNLTSGSSSSLLNTLVDKWFLGADVPALTSSASTYTTATGTMYNVAPSLNDAKQGMLGDCYLIASLVSIANKNAPAIQNMFLDNGDGTWTVKFYAKTSTGAMVSDFVTVNRRLPTNTSAVLSYAGYGYSATSASTILWIALAEKAYAQWNETGNAGRNGTNTYSGIESGWMHNANAQILGYSSTNYSFSTATQQSLINAIQSGLAVTAGTLSSVSGSSLVANHAYTVVSYDGTAATFQLQNPWGYQHPSPLTWAQLQSNFSLFTTTDPSGSSNAPGGGFGSALIVSSAPLVGIANSTSKDVVVTGDSSKSELSPRTSTATQSISIGTGFSQQTGLMSAISDPIPTNSSGSDPEESDATMGFDATDRALVDLSLSSELA